MYFTGIFKLAILVAALLVNSLLAIFVYKNNPKSATNILFGFLSLITSVWLVVIYLSLESAFVNSSLFLDRMSLFLAVPQAVSFFLLAKTVPKSILMIEKKIFFNDFSLKCLSYDFNSYFICFFRD